jgi:formate/nitrite transporter FocA (FNT family)
MIPESSVSVFWLIVAITWLIAARDFAHILAGSFKMWFLLVTGATTAGDAVFALFLPVLAGNNVGGTLVFTMLAWGLVQEEIDENPTE